MAKTMPTARAPTEGALAPRAITILLVDDHPVVRDGLAAMLQTEADFRVAGTAGTGTEAVERIAELEPDIVLLDLEMPAGNGITDGQLSEVGDCSGPLSAHVILGDPRVEAAVLETVKKKLRKYEN